MDMQIDNMQKYANYKEQFGRLKKALNNCALPEKIDNKKLQKTE